MARMFGLILIPIMTYIFPFYIHFKVLNKTGPGADFMSLKFRQNLLMDTHELSKFHATSYKTTGIACKIFFTLDIPYGSTITLKSKNVGTFLHSHFHTYPDEYTPGIRSSSGQQVNSKYEADKNSVWELMLDTLISDDNESLKNETLRGVRYLRNGDTVVLKHQNTNSTLKTTAFQSFLFPDDVEISASKQDWDTIPDTNKWKVYDHNTPLGSLLKSKTHEFQLINQKNFALVATYKLLPKWSFDQYSVSGRSIQSKTLYPDSIWIINDIFHERYVDGVDKDDPQTEKSQQKVETMNFAEKFLELQREMLRQNSMLVGSHPYASWPKEWPFVIRGMNFWFILFSL